ncbi:hypothetical protein ACFYTQ_10790 [Nocardia sp. NPDC004068]|uniref:hypothetical protein n=1 Tax=Nocardia sp. NPDC004068 TaxID=3364303 RepID=UPI00368A68CB
MTGPTARLRYLLRALPATTAVNGWLMSARTRCPAAISEILDSALSRIVGAARPKPEPSPSSAPDLADASDDLDESASPAVHLHDDAPSSESCASASTTESTSRAAVFVGDASDDVSTPGPDGEVPDTTASTNGSDRASEEGADAPLVSEDDQDSEAGR